ncbi:MAG: hypothetical protein WA322_05400 [Pseudolabrys sp.]
MEIQPTQMKKPAKQKPHRARQSRRRVAAEKGVESKPQSGDAPPHFNFLMRVKGSLPETIAKSDLETLNLGLGFLFARLREARQQYDKDADSGRAASINALGAMWRFIALFKLPLAELLHMPILKLQEALDALDQNNVLPILKPVARPGRAPSSDAYTALQGHAAGTVMRLRKLDLDPKQACTLVAKELAKLGVRPQRGANAITTDTVRHWCDVLASDVGRHGTAAMVYDSMFTVEENKRFDALPHAKAQSFALASLRQFVQEIFPQLRATAEKPS